MRASKTYHVIISDEDLSNYKRRYYASAVELWARAYTQFVIRRCIDAGFTFDNMPNQPFKWEDKDFDPIYAEIMEVFSARGWV